MLTELPGRGLRLARAPVALATALILAACGGSGGNNAVSPPASPPPPAPPPPPSGTVKPSLSISNAIINEGDSGTTTLQFTVTSFAVLEVGQTIANSRVDYSTTAGTATEGVDYEAMSGTLDIPGDTRQLTIDVNVIADTDVEPNETFTVTLSSPVNATIDQESGTGTIRDDDTPRGPSGLDDRPDNRTCIAPDRPTANSSVSISDPYPSLPDLVQPVKILVEPGSEDRWFALQKSGQIVTFATNNPTSVTEYIDLTDTRNISTCGECGLLGMAFHPDYPTTPEIFLSYNIDPNNRSILSRMTLDNVDTPGAGTTEEIILEVEQDFGNHNGGDIAFGPDGYLYFGLGDGGSANDPRARSQDTTRLLGSMLRIDVDGTGADYNIPPDNPFALTNAKCGPGANPNNDCPEIYAWGLRNPWRWSFDDATGQLWLADVGQGAREEVDLIELGGNYGWRCREGTLDTSNASDCGTGGGLIDPVTEYGRSDGRSITGGYVYRGDAIPEIQGLYIFADYSTGRFWAARPDEDTGRYENDELIDSNFNPTAFGVGPDDELYFVNIDGGTGLGRVRRLEPPATPVPDTIPDLLSNTGCVDPSDVTAPYSGLLPYDLNAPFWSDGAAKERYIGLPNGTTMDISADGDFDFPNGTVIVKNFRLGGSLIETRHLMRHPDGVWAGYTYEWNEAQTEATRVRGGKVVNIGGQDWIYPSEGQCMECHTGAAGFALGPEIAQLNKDFTYPSNGRLANQLDTIEHVMMFTDPLPAPPESLDALANPDDSGQPLELRARAYLHTNCSQCHRPNGPTPSLMDLRYSTPLDEMNACGVTPDGVRLGVPNARLISPGNPAESMIVVRMQRRDSHGMPPLGSNVIDQDNVARISLWIQGLASCD